MNGDGDGGDVETATAIGPTKQRVLDVFRLD